MICENPKNSLVNPHLRNLARRVFENSDVDFVSIRYDYLHGYIAEAWFADSSLKFFQKGCSANQAALNLARRIKNFCAEEQLTIRQNSEGLIQFVDVPKSEQKSLTNPEESCE